MSSPTLQPKDSHLEGGEIPRVCKGFIALVKRYTDFTELATPIFNKFIEKVIVYEATGDREHRKQEADIYFNFIENFVPPKQYPNAPALTAEQQEAERKKEARLDRKRKQNRLRMQLVRATQKAALHTHKRRMYYRRSKSQKFVSAI